MKYYIIINGVSSETIQGLAIESLPAISKPLQRSKQETIDGRDGDIITKLGYSAYDKTLKIGLWGNYDIDEVIKYFDTEGTITFSNEPDMYYNFNILNRIDFINQLEAFRKATITIHCQPFKYKEEETETLELEEHQEEGTSFNLEGTYEAPMQIDLKGNTSQVQLSGKNLFNPVIINNGTAIYTSNCTVSVSNGVISLTATATGRIDFGAGAGSGTNYSNDRGVLIPVEPNTTYQLSLSNQTFQRFYINKWNSSKVSLGGNSLYLPNTSYTTDENTYYISLDLIYANAVSGTTYSTTVQVEKGSTPTSYEEYCGGTPSPNPSYPQDIHNVSGNNQIVISDGASDTTTYNINLPVENLFDKDTIIIYSGYFNTRGVINSKNIDENNDKWFYIPCKPNTTYTITKPTTPTQSSNRFRVGTTTNIPEANDTLSDFWKMNDGDTTTTHTIITSSNANYLCIYYGKGDSNTDHIQSVLNGIQIEKGSKANSYTPYGTTPIELSKIGTYQDYFYKENDKWYLHKEIGKIVLDGSETYETAGTNTSGKYKIRYNGVSNLIKKPIDANTKGDIVSNQFIVLSANNTYRCNQGISVETNGKISFYDDTITQSTSAFTNWITTHNIIVYYALATPTNTEITDNTLLSQLEAIYNAKSKNGTTNINQENNDLPFILDIDYFTGTNEITITNNGNTYSKPTLTLTGSGVIGIYLNDSQIFQVSLGTNETIIIDINNMEAYYDATLKNRQVIGDYNNFRLIAGENKIKLTGDWDKLSVDNYSRWI